MGFARWQASVVHRDDFVFVGPEEDLAWAKGRMEKSFLVMVIDMLGGGQNDSQELRVLNRILCWMPEGILMKADPRPQKILTRCVCGKSSTRSAHQE